MVFVPRAPYGAAQPANGDSASDAGRRVGVPTVAMSPYGDRPEAPEQTPTLEQERGAAQSDLGPATVDVPAPPTPSVTDTSQVGSAARAATLIRVCPECEAENGNDFQFCTGCGSRIGESAARTMPDPLASLKLPVPPRPTGPGPAAPRRRGFDRGQRAIAVLFWGLVSLGGLWAGLTTLNLLTLLIGLLAGAYTVYLWRGGSVVIMLLPDWIWVPLAAVTGLRRAFGSKSSSTSVSASTATASRTAASNRNAKRICPDCGKLVAGDAWTLHPQYCVGRKVETATPSSTAASGKAAMWICPDCGKPVDPDALVLHHQHCAGGKADTAASTSAATSNKNAKSICPDCGKLVAGNAWRLHHQHCAGRQADE
jgi:predicted RNA-binding Zn-ribbon protein involved in translation (DUF1610 family)